MRIIFMGDSLTYGYKVPRQKVWTSLIAQQTGAEVVNCGVTGDTTGGMLSRFGREVLDQKPDVTMIMGGGNDYIMGADVGVVRANLSAMVHQSMAAGILPILGFPAPMVSRLIRDNWKKLADYDAIERDMLLLRKWEVLFTGTFGVPFVDFYALFAGRSDLESLYLDGMHPNAEGNRMMAETFMEVLERARPQKGWPV